MSPETACSPKRCLQWPWSPAPSLWRVNNSHAGGCPKPFDTKMHTPRGGRWNRREYKEVDRRPRFPVMGRPMANRCAASPLQASQTQVLVRNARRNWPLTN